MLPYTVLINEISIANTVFVKKYFPVDCIVKEC